LNRINFEKWGQPKCQILMILIAKALKSGVSEEFGLYFAEIAGIV
jgi:hypothetical protein